MSAQHPNLGTNTTLLIQVAMVVHIKIQEKELLRFRHFVISEFEIQGRMATVKCN